MRPYVMEQYGFPLSLFCPFPFPFPVSINAARLCHAARCTALIGALSAVLCPNWGSYYSRYGLAASEGTPVMRPLFFDFWEDDAAQGVDDQLMLGPTFLLAQQLLASTSSWVVFLPIYQTPRLARCGVTFF